MGSNGSPPPRLLLAQAVNSLVERLNSTIPEGERRKMAKKKLLLILVGELAGDEDFLFIDQVDLKLLEKQRIDLAGYMTGAITDTAAVEDSFDGLLNMLDVWSDKIYHREQQDK